MSLVQVIFEAVEEVMSVKLSWGRVVGRGAVRASGMIGGQMYIHVHHLAEANLYRAWRESILSPVEVCGLCVCLVWLGRVSELLRTLCRQQTKSGIA